MRQDRRRQLLVASGALTLWPFAAVAQPSPKIPRIGFMSLDFAGNPRGADGFSQGLRELGYVEGRNIVIEYADAKGALERMPALAAGLVAQKVDVIVAPSVLGARAAKEQRAPSRSSSRGSPILSPMDWLRASHGQAAT